MGCRSSKESDDSGINTKGFFDIITNTDILCVSYHDHMIEVPHIDPNKPYYVCDIMQGIIINQPGVATIKMVISTSNLIVKQIYPPVASSIVWNTNNTLGIDFSNGVILTDGKSIKKAYKVLSQLQPLTHQLLPAAKGHTIRAKRGDKIGTLFIGDNVVVFSVDMPTPVYSKKV